jgi:hypothetical protein
MLDGRLARASLGHMTNRFSFPVIVGGRRIHVGVAVERQADGSHRLWAGAGDTQFANGVPVPPEGLSLPIHVLGVPLVVHVGKAKAHLASIELG